MVLTPQSMTLEVGKLGTDYPLPSGIASGKSRPYQGRFFDAEGVI
jgi:hypothetical protein